MTLKETWRDVLGFEGLYQVSNIGRVKSLAVKGNKGRLLRDRILKQSVRPDGYLSVSLHKDGKQKSFLVHRLVADAHIENPDNHQQVNHKDENKTNNCASNLEWCTPMYNATYGSRNEKISVTKSVPIICVETGAVFLGLTMAGRFAGVSNQCIWNACNGKRKTAGGYHWKYKIEVAV